MKVSGVFCNFLGSVSLQQKFEATDRPVLKPPVTAVLFRKQRKIHPGGVRAGQPKSHEEKRSPLLNFSSSFYVFFSSPPGSAVCKVG